MKILLISKDCNAATISYKMKQEGCNVKLYIESKILRGVLDNLIPKTDNWRKELNWVGKDGLIVFDDIGYGKTQEQLRKQGYSVIGGSSLGDKLESDREWAQKILDSFGLTTIPTYNFDSIPDCIKFVKNNPNAWVIKQNGDAPKDINYVGHFRDGKDVVSMLSRYMKLYDNKLGGLTLQKRIDGIEIGVARFFNGKDWLGPIEINVEHKKMCAGNFGPTTGEMGTIAWFDNNENNVLFKRTLGKLKSFLREIDFRGDIDINCIVNRKGIFALEVTPRLGTPIIHLQSELILTPWHIFLKAIADQQNITLKWKREFGIVLLVVVPPFPYIKSQNNPSYGLEFFSDESLKIETNRHIHIEGLSAEKINGKRKLIFTDPYGYVLCVTSTGNTISEARNGAQRIIQKMHIPKMFYRNDIGVNLESGDLAKLKKWGYLN